MKKLFKRSSAAGFIQIPILIAIFVGLLVVGGGTYEGVKVYKQTKEEAKNVEKQADQGKESQSAPKPQIITAETATSTNNTAGTYQVVEPAVLAIAPSVSTVGDKPKVVVAPPKLTDVATSPKQIELPVTAIITPVVISPAITPPVTVSTQPIVDLNTQQKAIEISVNSKSTGLSTADLEWKTNIPTNSKIYYWTSGTSKSVVSSASGLSTIHIARLTGLKSGTSYSYEIEAISNEQVEKSGGTFLTKPDEYTISIQPEQTSVPASGWHYITVKVNTLKNGQNQANQEVSMTTPDSTQDKSFINDNNSLAGKTFQYLPKTVGAHTLAFAWHGTTKEIVVNATEYVEQKPAATASFPRSVLDVGVHDNYGLITVDLSNMEERMQFDGVADFSYNIISDNLIKSDIAIVPDPNTQNSNIIPKGEMKSVYFRIAKVPSKAGKFKIEVTNARFKLRGLESGNVRDVQNFSVVTPEITISDIPDVKFIGILNSGNYVTQTGGAPSNPGVMGSFKLQLNPNSRLHIVSCTMRIENSSLFKGYILKDGAASPYECLNNQDLPWYTESTTDGTGISSATYNLFVGWAGNTQINMPESVVRFYFDNLRVKDLTTGFIKTVQPSPMFEMQIVKP